MRKYTQEFWELDNGWVIVKMDNDPDKKMSEPFPRLTFNQIKETPVRPSDMIRLGEFLKAVGEELKRRG